MRYPEEVYRLDGKGGAAPAAEAELSREERRARRGAKKRTAKKHRAQKVRSSRWQRQGLAMRAGLPGQGLTRCITRARCICGDASRVVQTVPGFAHDRCIPWRVICRTTHVARSFSMRDRPSTGEHHSRSAGL